MNIQIQTRLYRTSIYLGPLDFDIYGFTVYIYIYMGRLWEWKYTQGSKLKFLEVFADGKN